MVLSSLVAYRVWQRTLTASESAVADAGEVLTDSISSGVSNVVDQLVAVAGLYHASESVERSEFTSFVDNLGIDPGVQGIAYAPRLASVDVAGFLDEVREVIPDFDIHEFDLESSRVPARTRDLHVPLQWLHPEQTPWEDPHGFDMASLPIVTDAIAHADGSGEIAATSFLRLPGQEDIDSMILIQPVSLDGESGVAGYTVALVELGRFLDGHLPGSLEESVAWELFDGTGETTLPGADWRTSFEVAGDRWHLAVSGVPGSVTSPDPSSALLVLIVGIVASLVAAFGASAYKQRAETNAELGRLRDLGRAKDRFLASVGHELRTPLTGVVGFTQLLKNPDNDLDDDEREKMIDSIARESADLAAIIDDLLVAARSELDLVTVTSQEVDLRPLVERVIDATREEKAREVSVIASADDVTVVGDPGRIRQIVRNLLVNAYRYGGNRIEVRLVRHGGMVILQVADSGPGLSPEEWEPIFEPYHRVDGVETVPAALGIGLSVSRHLSRLMGGDLVYRYQRGWSVFELRLPAVEAQQAYTPEQYLTGAN